MSLEPLSIAGVFLVRGYRRADTRGELRKVIGADDVTSGPLPLAVVEVALSTNRSAGTLRGLHYQVQPHAQAKTIWLTQGTVFDVVVDVRPDSPSYGEWAAVELSADDDVALHMPRGVAHGFQTLEDDTAVTYLMDNEHVPDSARTLRWNDPKLAIPWPRRPTVISDTDREGSLWPPSS